MYIVRFVYGLTGQKEAYLFRGHHGDFCTSTVMSEAGVLAEKKDFCAMIKALRTVIEYGPSIDHPGYDVWKDDRFELAFADEPDNDILDYTKHMREMLKLGMHMYHFKKQFPTQELLIQFVKLTAEVEISNVL